MTAAVPTANPIAYAVPAFAAAFDEAGRKAAAVLGGLEPTRKSQRNRRRSKFDVVASLPPPQLIQGAEFQAGVTPGNEALKVLLNGDPVPCAVAAMTGGNFGEFDARSGWVIVLSDPCTREGVAYFGGRQKLYGDVRLVPGDRC